MLRSAARLVLVLAVAGCADNPPPLADRPPPSPIVARTEVRLGEMAKVRPDSRDAKRVRLAVDVDADGRPLHRERPTVAFHFRVMPPTAETAPELRDAAVLAATLDADPDRKFVLAVRPTRSRLTATEVDRGGGEEDVSFDKVQVTVARPRHDAASHDGRMHVARVFGLDAKTMDAPYAPASFQASVLGTRLEKERRPAAFKSPGEGTWTVLRLVTPGEGYLAIDWQAGVGELFPKRGATSAIGDTILRAM